MLLKKCRMAHRSLVKQPASHAGNSGSIPSGVILSFYNVFKKITYLRFQDPRELFIKKKIFERVGFSFVTWKPPFGS